MGTTIVLVIVGVVILQSLAFSFPTEALSLTRKPEMKPKTAAVNNLP